jgi:hypothetical protein
MKLIDARVNGMPRQVQTKYGEKAVLDVATSEGQFTIWRNAGDREVMGRRKGERVTITLDSKGKASLVDTASNCPAVGLSTTQPAVTLLKLNYVNRWGLQPILSLAARWKSPITSNAWGNFTPIVSAQPLASPLRSNLNPHR